MICPKCKHEYSEDNELEDKENKNDKGADDSHFEFSVDGIVGVTFCICVTIVIVTWLILTHK